MGGCCSHGGPPRSPGGGQGGVAPPQGGDQGGSPLAVQGEYHTINVYVREEQRYRHVYLSTSDQQQRLFYGPPIGEPVNQPRHNYSILFKLTKGCSGDGYKISNFVTHKAGVLARLTPSGVKNEDNYIALDEAVGTEFTIEKIGTPTTIVQTGNSEVMWYPDRDGTIKAAKAKDGPLFLVEEAIDDTNIKPLSE